MDRTRGLKIAQLEDSALTLIELILSITLMGILILGITRLSVFSQYHLLSSSRRMKVQNQVSVVLEHMSKNIIKAMGDVNNPAVDITPISGDTAIQIYIDADEDGQISGGDYEIAYRWRPASATPADERYQIWYCDDCADASCATCSPSWGDEVIATLITNFVPGDTDNYVSVVVEGRYDPTTGSSLDNPEVEMKTNIMMPSVSVN